MSFTLKDIVEAEEIVKSDKGSSYIRSYPEFIKYFKDLKTIDVHNFIIGAHLVYSWMPTILDLKSEEIMPYAKAAYMCNRVKNGNKLEEHEIEGIASIVNSSLVGTSKLLHFINPYIYAIWDSRVYWFWGQRTPYSHRMQDSKAFISYLINCEAVANTNGFERVHQSVIQKIGYEVSAMRAIEWVAYKAFENRIY
jgi:hypothetical protein